MPAWILWAWNNRALCVIGVLALLCGALAVDRLALKADLANDKVTITQLTDANTAFKDAVEHQNAAIKKLQDDAYARMKIAEAQIDDAAKLAAKYRAKVAVLNAQPLTGDDCQNMKTLVDGFYANN